MSVCGLNASHPFAITGGLFLSNQIPHQDVTMDEQGTEKRSLKVDQKEARIVGL
jgi:hypothetical protein